MRFLTRIWHWLCGFRIDSKERVESVLGHAVSAIEQASERLEYPCTQEDANVAQMYLRQAREILDFV